MKQIPLTQGRFALVDDADFALVNRHRWRVWHNAKRGPASPYYAVANARSKTNGKRSTLKMHCLILGHAEVDHKNRNGLDNQRENLRPATDAQNQANRGKQRNNTSGAKGVWWSTRRGKWYAQIGHNGKRINIGSFVTKELAEAAYRATERQLKGEYAHVS